MLLGPTLTSNEELMMTLNAFLGGGSINESGSIQSKLFCSVARWDCPDIPLIKLMSF